MSVQFYIAIAAIALGFSAASSANANEVANGLSVNGLSVNGLSVNGLSVNGLSVNGLSVNGLSVNGLSVNGRDLQGRVAADASALQVDSVVFPDGSFVLLK
jgi:hypothetical protein